MNKNSFLAFCTGLPNGRVQPRREAQRSGVGWNPLLGRLASKNAPT
jgi:hypothetical protein